MIFLEKFNLTFQKKYGNSLKRFSQLSDYPLSFCKTIVHYKLRLKKQSKKNTMDWNNNLLKIERKQ